MTSYTVQGDLISGIEPGISAAEFKENISFADGVNWILSAADGEEKTDDKLMQTGDRIQILSPNGVVWQTYTILIYGDVNGDGMIDIFDLVGVRNHIIQTAELAEISFLAGDVNRDGTVDIFDLVGVRNHIIQFALIEQ